MNITTAALFQRPIAYLPVVAKATGSVKLTVLWSQINYWTDRTAKDADGWVYKTQNEIYEETGLSRKEQETARDIGAKLGVLASDVRGTPPTVHFKVDRERMAELVERHERENGKKEEKIVRARPANTIAYLKALPEADVAEIASRMKVSTKCVRDRAQDVIDYCEAKGKRYSDYKAALRNFIKSHVERHPDAIVRESTASVINHEDVARRDDMTPEQRAAANRKLDEMRAELARKKAMKV